MSKELIITIGGSKDYTDFELGFLEIDKALEVNNIKLDDILYVYGYGSNATEGAFCIAKDWAEKHFIKFLDGTPKFKKYEKFENGSEIAVAERNESLAKASTLLIQLSVGKNTGGNSIADAFSENGVTIVKCDLPKPPEPPYVPSSDSLAKAIATNSLRAKGLIANGVMLDTETTGLVREVDSIIELTITNCKNKKVLFDSLLYTDVESHEQAFAKHQITKDMLEGKPEIGSCYEAIVKAVKNKTIVASNSDFDEEMLHHNLQRSGLELNAVWYDLLALYRKYSAQPKSKVKSLPTDKMCKQMGVTPGTHRSLSDVTAQLEVLYAMAEGRVPNFIY